MNRLLLDVFDRTLAIVPHADDELIGMGGTLMKARAAGCSVRAVLVCGGNEESRSLFFDSVEHLRCEARHMMYRGYCDPCLDRESTVELVERIEREVDSFEPSVVVVVHPGTHQEHRTVYECVRSALRYRDVAGAPGLIVSESPSIASFAPSLYVDVSEFSRRKAAAWEAVYASREGYNGRSGNALKIIGAYRGLSIGVEQAEAFEVERMVI